LDSTVNQIMGFRRILGLRFSLEPDSVQSVPECLGMHKSSKTLSVLCSTASANASYGSSVSIIY